MILKKDLNMKMEKKQSVAIKKNKKLVWVALMLRF